MDELTSQNEEGPSEPMEEPEEKTYAEQFMESMGNKVTDVCTVTVKDMALGEVIAQLKALTARVTELEAWKDENDGAIEEMWNRHSRVTEPNEGTNDEV